MKRTFLLLLVILAMATGLSAARKALVIGNASYAESPLRNPVNDAEDVTAALKKVGFSVSTHSNLDREGMDSAIAAFVSSLTPNDEALVYYSGHGVQIDGINYLIPVRENIDSVARCKYLAYSGNMLVEELKTAALSILILDACRDNPFARTKSLNKGLASMQAAAGSQYIIFATAEGQTADDGNGRNSPFAEALVHNINTSTKKITDLMQDVTNEVAAKTAERQIPWTAGNLRRDFYFSAAPAIKDEKPVTPSAPKPQVETVWLYGSLEVETNLAGDLYLNGEKLQSLAAGQKAKINKLVTGDYTVELRTAEGSKTQQVTVVKDQTQSLAFKFEKKAQPAVTTPTPSNLSTPAVMVLVEGGSFNMGSNDGDSGEQPVHKVTVSSFYIGKHEVTQKEWREVMGTSPSRFKGDDKPVEQVSWYDAIEYCNKRSLKEGLAPCYSIDKTRKDPNNTNSSDDLKWIVSVNWQANGYRLPTEAEWEYAARGGNKSKGYTYSGSNDIGSVAWYWDNAGSKGDKHADYGTHKAGSKAANELGIFDMSGNLWEWCWDWYDSGYYGKSQSSDPIGAGSGSYRVVRGGSWNCNDDYCRVANRVSFNPVYGYISIGFRLLRAIK